ncbi:MAG: hypothetical protein KC443_25340, partial [Anaerolineales bacterium]|nr:hypothetical protein [Anaerolineales bacterium]
MRYRYLHVWYFGLLALMVLVLSGQGTAVAAPSAPLANDLRISQAYGGGGNSGAVYTHDFIEI